MLESKNILELFGNFNVFLKLYGSYEQFDLFVNMFELFMVIFRMKNFFDLCNVIQEKDYNLGSGDFCYEGNGLLYVVDKNMLVLLFVIGVENNYNFQKFLKNIFFLEVVNIVD